MSRLYFCKKCGRTHEPPTGKKCRKMDEDLEEGAGDEDMLMGGDGQQREGRKSPTTGDGESSTPAAEGSGRQRAQQTQSRRGPRATRRDEAEAHDDWGSAGRNLLLEREGEEPALRQLQNAADRGATAAAATPSSVRHDPAIMEAVARRIIELGIDQEAPELAAGGSGGPNRRGKKSGQARTVEDLVLKDIDWPHFYLYRGADRRPVKFTEMNLNEFVYGFLCMLNNPRFSYDKVIMVNLLQEMMADAMEFSWMSVRNFYRVIASSIEMMRFDWGDMDRIQALRVQYAQRGSNPGNNRQQNRELDNSLFPCMLYQRGECHESTDHGRAKHICAFCYKVRRIGFPHPEGQCRRKAFLNGRNLQGQEQ